MHPKVRVKVRDHLWESVLSFHILHASQESNSGTWVGSIFTHSPRWLWSSLNSPVFCTRGHQGTEAWSDVTEIRWPIGGWELGWVSVTPFRSCWRLDEHKWIDELAWVVEGWAEEGGVGKYPGMGGVAEVDACRLGSCVCLFKKELLPQAQFPRSWTWDRSSVAWDLCREKTVREQASCWVRTFKVTLGGRLQMWGVMDCPHNMGPRAHGNRPIDEAQGHRGTCMGGWD